MKRTPLLLAALVPFAATAANPGSPTVDQQALNDDYQVTRILGAEIQSSDGQGVGTVEDVIFDSDGNISSVLVQREGTLAGAAGDAGQNAEQGWEDTAGEEGQDADMAETQADSGAREEGAGMDVSVDPDRAGSTEIGDEFSRLQWSDVSYDAEEEIFRLNDLSSLETVGYDQSSAQTLGGEVRASKLVGLEVHLSDEESFGEVEDVMLDPRTGKASAIVVDSMEFFDKERYALPVSLDGINTEEESLTLQLTEQQVKDMGEFEMNEPDSSQ